MNNKINYLHCLIFITVVIVSCFTKNEQNKPNILFIAIGRLKGLAELRGLSMGISKSLNL
jgi:hypothetical protein